MNRLTKSTRNEIEGRGQPEADKGRTRWVRVMPARGAGGTLDIQPNSQVCIVARSLGSAGPMSEWLASLGVAVNATKDLAGAIANLRGDYKAWAAVVVFADGFGGPVECFDQLRLLREECPGLPVIVVSESFGESDFSTERLPLCDVCLRFPVDPAEMTTAWVCAMENSRKWRQFKFELRKMALRAFRDGGGTDAGYDFSADDDGPDSFGAGLAGRFMMPPSAAAG